MVLELGKQYLYGLREPVELISKTEKYLVFKGKSTTYKVSAYNLKNIREPFKFIKVMCE